MSMMTQARARELFDFDPATEEAAEAYRAAKRELHPFWCETP